jgi:hypothetical protein
MNLIALTGYKQSGKSTAAAYLAEKHGYCRHNFKDALVEEMKERLPDVLRELTKLDHYPLNIDTLFKTKPPLMRALMQNYGTEVRRGDKKTYWSDKWLITYTNKIYPQPTVVDDLRFLSERDALKSVGGTIIRIVRTDIASGGDHSSETEQDEIVADYTIKVGKGDHAALYQALDDIITQ